MRCDNKGRQLYPGEYQRPDGKYEYKYMGIDGKRHSISCEWLEPDDVPLNGFNGRITMSLREIERSVIVGRKDDEQRDVDVPVKDKILLDIDEAVALFGLPRNHLYDIAKQHKELTYTTGRNIHFKRAPLEQYVLGAVN